MPRKIEYLDDCIEISDYIESNRYCNQENWIKGIPLNPLLRDDFDSTPNDEREPLEIEDWWNKPYIVTYSWDDMNESWDQYKARMTQYGYDETSMDTEAVFLKRMSENKERWFRGWPSGTRYEVCCLNGGAWDRATSLAMVGSLDAAVAIAADYVPVNYFGNF